ncbi:MAG: hypothetical protein JWO82_4382 [Akkermansiaceae bacterium]|nr:hypothetical protein [Akkermansiaceae bacterium]
MGVVVPCPRVAVEVGGGGPATAGRPAAGGEEKDPALVVEAEDGGERW